MTPFKPQLMESELNFLQIGPSAAFVLIWLMPVIISLRCRGCRQFYERAIKKILSLANAKRHATRKYPRHSVERQFPLHKKKSSLSRKPERIFNKLELENFQPEKNKTSLEIKTKTFSFTNIARLGFFMFYTRNILAKPLLLCRHLRLTDKRVTSADSIIHG